MGVYIISEKKLCIFTIIVYILSNNHVKKFTFYKNIHLFYNISTFK
jgi:hypothetical protein